MSAHIHISQIHIHLPMLFAMLAAAPFAAWLKTLDGLCVWSNPAADKLMGRPITGLTTDELFGEQAPSIKSYENLAVNGGCDQRLQFVRDTVVLVNRFPVEHNGLKLVAGVAIQTAPHPGA
jgi:hypothetical protein